MLMKSPAARSILVFGVYLLLLGAGLMIVPNLILMPFGFLPTREVWLRLAGSLVAIIGFFFFVSARAGYDEDGVLRDRLDLLHTNHGDGRFIRLFWRHPETG
jgi:hypothetical protein